MSCGVSVMATLPQPLPVLITTGLVSGALLLSLLLPEGGRFLPKAIKVSESVTLMDVMPLQHTIHDTILMASNMHTLNFNETYREKVLGAQRPRLNESCIDPDLLHIDMQEVSKLVDLWRFGE